jgi:hypothetical protein
VTVAATLTWPRILTPAEAVAVRSAIGLPRLQVLFDVLLYTGMMYAELLQLRDDPDRYDEVRGTVAIDTLRVKRRAVVLGDRGREAVEAFLGSGARMSDNRPNWGTILIHAARRAGLSPNPDPPPLASLNNPSGITVSSTRKTWESWLYALHPGWVRSIVASQGRENLKDVRRYDALCWSADDLDAMRFETAGWEPLDLRLLGPPGGFQTADSAGDGPFPVGMDVASETLRLRAEEATIRVLAAKAGLTPDEVRACVAPAGVRTPPRLPFRSPTHEVFESRGAEIIAAYESGWGLGPVAKEAGVSVDALRRFLTLHDVQLRCRGQPRKLRD